MVQTPNYKRQVIKIETKVRSKLKNDNGTSLDRFHPEAHSVLMHFRKHCCYQKPFQEVNIPMNRALLPNCKIDLTDSPFLKLF